MDSERIDRLDAMIREDRLVRGRWTAGHDRACPPANLGSWLPPPTAGRSVESSRDLRRGDYTRGHARSRRACGVARAGTDHLADPDTLVVDELGLLNGGARVDIAVVNGTVHGYELKSASDTLARLPKQIAAYCAVLDYVTLVVAANHANAALEVVPDWWGILIATMNTAGEVELKAQRSARENPSVDPKALARLLWRDEALEELERRGLADGVRSKPRREVYAKLTATVPLSDLRAVVRRQLKRREGWRADRVRT